MYLFFFLNEWKFPNQLYMWRDKKKKLKMTMMSRVEHWNHWIAIDSDKGGRGRTNWEERLRAQFYTCEVEIIIWHLMHVLLSKTIVAGVYCSSRLVTSLVFLLFCNIICFFICMVALLFDGSLYKYVKKI